MLIQHGYGKGSKVSIALDDGIADGVILSPRDETPERLLNLATDCATRGARVYVDPQVYALNVSERRDGHLGAYDYYNGALTRADLLRPGTVRGLALDCIGFQQNVPGVEAVIAPSVLFDDFDDAWSVVALQFAAAAAEVAADIDNPVLASVVVDERAFTDRDSVDDFLDVLTSFDDLAGVYLILKRAVSAYPTVVDVEAFSNYLYMVHALGTVNELQVVCGYADIPGLVARACGATDVATGWFSSLREFTLRRFIPSTGGSAPRPRYTSERLWNSILLVPELASISDEDEEDLVLSSSGGRDDVFRRQRAEDAAWPPELSFLHHIDVLSALEREVVTPRSTRQRVQVVLERLREADALYAQLAQIGATFGRNTGSAYPRALLQALNSFVRDVAP